ncbi:hypothetical protein [Thermococcus sp.]|uniref:hypothetical protein n=1 Tax=Thermococcus sp. TaxID=35749 RepID=UPI00261FDF80|nr:hypothetical protein [Thermococcus sp.]
MVKVNVEPAEYYPIVDKLFTEGIVEALDAVGLSVEGIDAKVKPSEDNVGVDFSLVVASKGNRGVSRMEDFIRIAVERMVEEANGRFKWMGSGKFVLGELKLVEAGETDKQAPSAPRISVEAAPDELKGALEKVAKGLWIKLQEKGVMVAAVALSFEGGTPPMVTARLVLKGNPPYERELLADYISDKIEAYLWTTVGKGDYNVNVQLSTPSGNEKEGTARDEEIKNDNLMEPL